MTRTQKPGKGEASVYLIRIEGHLGPQWTDWFEGMSIKLEEGGVTLLTGPVADQAVLYGLLRKVRDLGMPLLSVDCLGRAVSIAPGEAGKSEKPPINR